MFESKEALVERHRRDTIRCAAQRVIGRHGLGGASVSAIAEGTSAILQRRLEDTGRPPEEDVEWIVDLLLNGLSSRSRA